MIGLLNKKILRDIWNIKGQMAAIIMVMAAGIAFFVILFGVVDSLKLTKSTYYQRYQFADVFASLKRAPNSLQQRVNDIPGVSVTQTRVVFGVTLQIENMVEPASGKVISLPDSHSPILNQLYLRSGRMLFPNEEDVVLADEAFFDAHHYKLGDKVSLVMNGHQRYLTIVGVVLSPEYVYSIAPGAMMPDPKRYGVFWMSRHALEAAVNMKGAFNDLSIKTQRNANLEVIKSQLDSLLKPYGGLIAYGRDEQVSNFFVENELDQLRAMGFLAPIIFLSVAAFLMNVVMSRLIATQRMQIGMLKAIGYSNREISAHYLKMVLFITVLGSIIGLSLGAWIGVGMTNMYTVFFHFPILQYSFSLEVMIFAVLICSMAAIVGTLFSIKKAADLPPAEAMRPESPTHYKQSLLDRIGVHKQLNFIGRIVLRQLERRPFRALLSAIGLAFALALLIFSFFMEDTTTHLMDVQYNITQREDVSLTFVEARSASAIEEIKVLPGVLRVEPVRSVAVTLTYNHHKKRTTIMGLQQQPDLRRVIDNKLNPVLLPSTGLVLNNKLAQILHVKVGDRLEVEVLEDKRATLTIPITAVTQEYIGLGAFMQIDELNRLLDEPPKITGVSIQIDDNYSAILYNKLKKIPSVVGLNIISVLRQIFESLMAENLLQMVGINIIFASFISFGVVYNTARIALSERGRELGSLRVLGLTRKEVATILFGELTAIIAVSIPLGLFLGTLLAKIMTQSLETELFRIPFYINKSTYGYAVIIVATSALLSFYLVWRQLNKINLVDAQKGVE